MALSTGPTSDFVIAPREICATCHNSTGPKFVISHLRGPSDFHRSNIIPTGSERESVETSIASAYTEVAQLDNEIVRLQTTLNILNERRDALYRFAKQEEGLFSPIRKLPADVLRQIFLIVHPGHLYLLCDNLDEFPRVVTQVSSYWRSVAHSCAHMWSKVYAPRYQRKFGETYGELIRKCVTYSNELPMKLELLDGCTPRVLGSDCVHALERCAYRWKSLTISDAELSKAIFSGIPAEASFNELTHLSLQLSAAIALNPSPMLTNLSVTGVHDTTCDVRIHSAESLVDVTLKSIFYPLSVFGGIPWIQITKFEASDIYYRPGEFCDLLDKMKNLVLLSLTRASDPVTTGLVSLPELESLILSGDTEENALDILITPNLKHLSLTCEFDLDSVVGFAERSRFSLDGLKICGMEIDDSWVSPEFDTTKILQLEDPQTVWSGIEWLTNYGVPSPAEIFPRLKSLNIFELRNYQEEDGEWTVEDVICMLESRIPTQKEDDPAITGRYLKHVLISFVGCLNDGDVAKLKEFIYSDPVERSGVSIMVTDSIVHIETRE